ncbi:acyclic terpene utilization AtuA family protein [Desulfotomaculum copahuensis]|uniref:3-methylaspartate ammonia-lyase n=1 Tax=Desulfotomaculum copahuensis TaxID=1838280 RepID=A0A1B7LDR1_9FIRM|nr:acyclic terpene utilization AtuA family protein [Desulfotomaculum copahuensis]OAT81246.1 3-methylaspartate ammonia-lyase [Desulfotomaculum copahuensis]
MEELRILSPTAILGYGFPEESFRAGLALDPHVIAVDAGSTDPGPYYLGAGVSFTERAAVKRDLALILEAGCSRHIPVLIGTAGGSGAKPHLDWCLDIIKEIAAAEKLRFRMAVVPADVDKDFLRRKIRSGTVMPPLGPPAPLQEADVDKSTYIVAQMGVEPLVAALDAGVEVVVAGRAYDPAVFAALPVHLGYDRGLALHLGKILECAAIAAEPGSGSDCMFGWLRRDHFLVAPLNPQRRCTVTSVAAHTLYEKSDPYFLPGPGGALDLHAVTFRQHNERQVYVAGSRFVPSQQYTVKLEGAGPVGFRTVSIAGARDPVFIRQLDQILAGVRERVADNFHALAGQYRLLFHIYGRNGIMGELEPLKEQSCHELCLVIEAVASTQETAGTICGFTRSTLLHYGYPGRLSTAGNLAFPYSPSDFQAGPVYQFVVHHLLTVDDPLELF